MSQWASQGADARCFRWHIRLLNDSKRLVQYLETKRYEKDVRLPDTGVTNEDDLKQQGLCNPNSIEFLLTENAP
jgi:hypothetical protein